MGIRTVRLDGEAEQALAKLRRLTGLSISEVLKRGLMTYSAAALKQEPCKPYGIFEHLDLGEGGHARAPAKNAKESVIEVIREKHKR